MKTRHPLYGIWAGMKSRCYNPRSVGYKYYGGRGITVCDRWRFSFDVFITDMGPRPAGTSIDRINNDGNYEPGNCRWADKMTQVENKSRPICTPRRTDGKRRTPQESFQPTPENWDRLKDLKRGRRTAVINEALSTYGGSWGPK